LTTQPAQRHRNEKISKKPIKYKNRVSRTNLEETVRVIVREGSPGGRSETTGVGFVKQVKREKVMDEQSGESKEEEVIGEEIGKSEMEDEVDKIGPKWS